MNLVISMSGGMKIFVKKMKGKKIKMEVEKYDKIENVKDKIKEKEGINNEKKRIIFDGKKMEDGSKI
jgi:ubiquitin